MSEWDIYNKAFLGFSEGGHGLIADALDISLSNPNNPSAAADRLVKGFLRRAVCCAGASAQAAITPTTASASAWVARPRVTAVGGGGWSRRRWR